MIAAIAEKIENDQEDLDKTTTSQIQHGTLEALYFLLVPLPEPGSTVFSFRKNLPYAVLVILNFLSSFSACRHV